MITILYFARLREQLGLEREQFELGQATTVAAIKSELCQRGDLWQQSLTADNILVAINQQLSQNEDQVQAGDELAFFPPVTGG